MICNHEGWSWESIHWTLSHHQPDSVQKMWPYNNYYEIPNLPIFFWPESLIKSGHGRAFLIGEHGNNIVLRFIFKCNCKKRLETTVFTFKNAKWNYFSDVNTVFLGTFGRAYRVSFHSFGLGECQLKQCSTHPLKYWTMPKTTCKRFHSFWFQWVSIKTMLNQAIKIPNSAQNYMQNILLQENSCSPAV